MFFVMSGFVMMLGYAGKGPVSGCAGSFSVDFWCKRVARIGPVVWLSLLLCIPITVNRPSQTAGIWGDSKAAQALSYLTTATFVQTWVGLGVNGPLWSVCGQFFCYHWFPVLVGPMHTVRNTRRLISEVCVHWATYYFMWGALFTIGASHGGVGFGYLFAHVSPMNKVPLFLIGVVFGSHALTNEALKEKPVAYVAKWANICNSISAFMSGYFFMQVTVGFEGAMWGGGITRVAGELLFPPLYGVWLYSFTQRRLPASVIASPAGSRSSCSATTPSRSIASIGR